MKKLKSEKVRKWESEKMRKWEREKERKREREKESECVWGSDRGREMGVVSGGSEILFQKLLEDQTI